MRVWYTVLALANLLAGSFLVTSTFAFDPDTTVNIGLGVSIAVAIFGLAMGFFGLQSTKGGERFGLGVLGWLTAGLASWTIVATQVFDVETARWLVFASGLGHIILSVAGIITEEAATS